MGGGYFNYFNVTLTLCFPRLLREIQKRKLIYSPKINKIDFNEICKINSAKFNGPENFLTFFGPFNMQYLIRLN